MGYFCVKLIVIIGIMAFVLIFSQAYYTQSIQKYHIKTHFEVLSSFYQFWEKYIYKKMIRRKKTVTSEE